MNTRKYVVNTLAVICVCLPMLAQSAPIEYTGSPKQFEDNGHWYDLVLHQRTWDAAKIEAEGYFFVDPVTGEELAGHLATITTAEENAFIIKDKIDGGVDGIGWIGGFQTSGSDSPKDGWNWVTGEEWNYTEWAPLEPNDKSQSETDTENNDENVLELWATGFWNDYEGGTTPLGAYVIEFESASAVVPVPAAAWLFGSGLFGLVAVARRKESL